MPYSTGIFKKETIDYIKENFDKDTRILDIGAGAGGYAGYLAEAGYHNLDCLEVFEPYVEMFDLKTKYNNVYVDNVLNKDSEFFKQFDLIVMGDVLEHIDYETSKDFMKRLNVTNLIVALPFSGEQGEVYGNIHETHLQTDLDFIKFMHTYEGFFPLCLFYDYAVYINRPLNYFYTLGHLPENYVEYIAENFNIEKQISVEY